MFENFKDPVDNYCERLSPDFWAEPTNALTNLAFILAAFLAYRLYRRSGQKGADLTALVILSAVVGIGSFIFHTFATQGAMLADIIPIVVFIHVSVAIIFMRIFNMKLWQSIGCVIAFLVFNVVILNIFGKQLFNGSIQYVPTFLLLIGVAITCQIKRHPQTRDFFIAAIAFLVSLTLRSTDMQVCPSFPLGTHFLWHMLNGITMYYVMQALINSRRLSK